MAINVISSTNIVPQMNRVELLNCLDEARYQFNLALAAGQKDIANSYANEIIEYKIRLGLTNYRVGY